MSSIELALSLPLWAPKGKGVRGLCDTPALTLSANPFGHGISRWATSTSDCSTLSPRTRGILDPCHLVFVVAIELIQRHK